MIHILKGEILSKQCIQCKKNKKEHMYVLPIKFIFYTYSIDCL